MAHIYKIGDSVRLKSFLGRHAPPPKIALSENYWLLIGKKGKVIQSPSQKSLFADFSKEKRVLVQFDDSLEHLFLESHNEVINSLWILITDLESEPYQL